MKFTLFIRPFVWTQISFLHVIGMRISNVNCSKTLNSTRRLIFLVVVVEVCVMRRLADRLEVVKHRNGNKRRSFIGNIFSFIDNLLFIIVINIMIYKTGSKLLEMINSYRPKNVGTIRA